MSLDVIALIVAGVALVLAGGAIVALLGARRQQAEAELRHNEAMAQLRSEMRALSSSAVGVGRKLTELEHQVEQVAEARDEPEPAVAGRAEKPYQMAAMLLQRGADIEELMSVCEITRGEAELLASLYRKQSA